MKGGSLGLGDFLLRGDNYGVLDSIRLVLPLLFSFQFFYITENVLIYKFLLFSSAQFSITSPSSNSSTKDSTVESTLWISLTFGVAVLRNSRGV